MTLAFRLLAIVIAIGGTIDPVFTVSQPRAVAVDFATQSSASALGVRDRIVRTLGGSIDINTGRPPDALVIVGLPNQLDLPRIGTPASVVSLVPSNARNVRLLTASIPNTVLVNQETTVTATFEAVGMIGEASNFSLEQNGVSLASTAHRWTSDPERFTTTLRYAPPAAGLSRLTVVALPVAREASDDDNAADLALVVSQRRLRVAIYEPRPSWASSFVRRALELDPVFETASLVRPSRGTSITAGAVLSALSADSLSSFDAVIVGAPEELTSADVSTISMFCEARGGAAIFIPDRKPSGPYAQLISPSGFDEVVLEKAVSLAGDPFGVRASELAVPRSPAAAAIAIASTPSPPSRMVVGSQPHGRGTLVFSGALDAWRFRSDAPGNSSFDRFWTGIVANLAFSAPRRVAVSVTPAIAAPGDRMRMRVAVDPQLLNTSSGLPPLAVQTSLIARDGRDQFVRVWPTAERGVFEGEITAVATGTYDARAKIGEYSADMPIMIETGLRQPPRYDAATLGMIAAATGGVRVDASDIGVLERHLRSLSRMDSQHVHPMRSGWWSVPFVAALCGEWAVRRKRGAR
jgi:hypothetical protein